MKFKSYEVIKESAIRFYFLTNKDEKNKIIYRELWK